MDPYKQEILECGKRRRGVIGHKVIKVHPALHVCSGLEKRPFGAKCDFEIWALKVFTSLYQRKSPKECLEVTTPENLKWKKYLGQSENANGSLLEPRSGSQKIKVSTKRTL